MQAHTISKLITSRVESPNVPQVLDRFDYPELINMSRPKIGLQVYKF